MDPKHVYLQLQELFPQVDSRILKAVAIEHSKDCDSAAEFIINEVLPSLGQPSKPATSSTHETLVVPSCEGLVDEHREQLSSDDPVSETVKLKPILQENAELCDSAHVISNSVAKTVEIVDLEPSNNSSSVYILEHLSTPIPQDRTNSTLLSSKAKGKNIEPIEIVDVEASKYDSLYDLECVDTIMSHNSFNSLPVSSELEGKNMAIVEFNEFANVEPSSGVFLHDVRGSGTAISVNSTSSSSPDLNAKGKNTVDTEACHFQFSSNTNESTVAGTTILENMNAAASGPGEQFSMHCNATTSSSSLQSYHDVIENTKESSTKDANGACDCEEHLVRSLANGSEQLESNNDVALFEKSLPKLLTSRSGHVVNIDLLEDSVTDAKSSKKDLVYAVESVVNMIKEAELLEEKCRQAKEEASSAGQGILAKVNELKEMLQRAKQANDMHAGEVFGEKSVLTTEARELQSRLLNLAEEKDKSLSLVEQMQKSLETRLLAARNGISAAEKEKHEKEGLALKALEEQEAIMESIVLEARKLKEESEENAKLREFLDDRGRVVDSLEGEIAVILEDVMSLKRRVDDHRPLKGSLLVFPYGAKSSQSSSFSDKSTALSTSDVLPEEQQALNRTDSALDFSHELEDVTNSLSKFNATTRWNEKSLSDEDEWEILRNEVGQF